MSGCSGTLLGLPSIEDALLGLDGRLVTESLPPPSNPLLDFVQNHLQGALDLYRLFLNPPPQRETIPKPLNVVIAQPVIVDQPKPIKSVTEIHSSSSASVSVSGKLPQPLESSGGSSSSFHNFKPSESFGSSIGHRTYGPPQVGRSGHLFATRISLPIDDEVESRFPGETE